MAESRVRRSRDAPQNRKRNTTRWGNQPPIGEHSLRWDSASKRVFNYVDDQIWKALWKWSLKRHPNKGKKWVAKRYFQLNSGHGWTFKATVNDRRGGKKTITIHKLRTISIERHTKVKGNASPDNSTLEQYWQSRKTKYGKSYWVKGSKLYKVALQQSWKCPGCGEHLSNGEALHTHHKIAVKV